MKAGRQSAAPSAGAAGRFWKRRRSHHGELSRRGGDADDRGMATIVQRVGDAFRNLLR
jgi:hypothetical protein